MDLMELMDLDGFGVMMCHVFHHVFSRPPNKQAKNKRCVGLADAAWLEPPTLRVSFFKSRRSRDGTCGARTTQDQPLALCLHAAKATGCEGRVIFFIEFI